MQREGLALSRLLVGVGFILVGVADLPLIGFASASQASQYFYWTVSAVGFSLLGAAFWRWLTALSGTTDPTMRTVFRLFAIACVVLGVAYLGLLNELVQAYRQKQHFGLRWRALSDGLSLGGFGLAAVGFWGASAGVTWPDDAEAAPSDEDRNAVTGGGLAP